MKLTAPLKALFIETSQTLKGHERRLFMAKVVRLLGPGGQRQAEKELGWNRGTIRKGNRELSSNLCCAEAFSARGRKKIEEKLPHLCEDIKAIVDAQSQIDPSFKTQRLYTRIYCDRSTTPVNYPKAIYRCSLTQCWQNCFYSLVPPDSPAISLGTA